MTMTQQSQSSMQTPTLASALDEVRSQTSKELGIDVGDIAEDTVLKELRGADSVRLLRIVAQIERLYDVEFEDEDIFRVSTPGELAQLVVKQSAEA